MAKCEFEFFNKTEPYYAAYGHTVTVVRCKTHHMESHEIVDNMCPLGRIEQATENALAKIAAAAASLGTKDV